MGYGIEVLSLLSKLTNKLSLAPKFEVCLANLQTLEGGWGKRDNTKGWEEV